MPKTATKKRKSRYIRIPLDLEIEKLIALVQAQNPFFTELDAIRFALGKFIVQNNNTYKNKLKFVQFLNNLKDLHKDTPEFSEDEIFAILEENDLI